MANYNPALPAAYPFTNVQSNYWSATTYADFASYAWLVEMYYGSVILGFKTSPNYVLPVRGGQ
jgi:hypothetical protein